jgi:hypothetical protein
MAAKSASEATASATIIEVDGKRVDLKNRNLAALLAWLVPGAGHYYQGRRVKAAIYFFAILSTFIVGMSIGGSNVVYASWVPGDKRWHFVCQLGAGVVTFPALVQGNYMRKHTNEFGETMNSYDPGWGTFMAPPRRPVREDEADDVAAWYVRFGAGYEMGTWYTMIAGLLNILAIYDAYAGPLATPISGKRREEDAGPEPTAAEPEEGT